MGRELSDDLADDLGEIFTDVNDFGQVVTHNPTRAGTAISIAGVFTPGGGTDFSAKRYNREQTLGAQLLIPDTDVNGASYTLDEGGTFTVGGIKYQIAQADPTPGGYVVKLTRENRKTLTAPRS